MSWRETQSASRKRYLAKFDQEEVDQYEEWVLQLGAKEEAACLADISRGFEFRAGMTVLDAGAGTGALSFMLKSIPGLAITALEPSPVMLARLQSKPELRHVKVVEAFCDAPEDRDVFPGAVFDVIVSRQLANGLFDPLTAFRNWHHWLKAGGLAIVIDGLYDRFAWTGRWQEEVDVLPLSACRTTATVPYLMEAAGFRVNAVHYMEATNAVPSTRTQRYIVFAAKDDR